MKGSRYVGRDHIKADSRGWAILEGDELIAYDKKHPLNKSMGLNIDCIKKTMEAYDSITGYEDLATVKKKYDEWVKSCKIPVDKVRYDIIEMLLHFKDRAGEIPTSEIVKALENDLGEYILQDEVHGRIEHEIGSEAEEVLYVTLKKLVEVK